MMKTLYVEDNPFDRDLTRRALLKQVPDLIWETASSVHEARQCLATRDYDVLLLDMWLGDGTGLDILLHVRRVGIDVAVVAVAGAGDEASVIQFLKAGAQDYLPKRGNYLDHIGAHLQQAIARRRDNFRPATVLTVLYVENHADDADLALRYFERRAPHLNLVVHVDGESALGWLKQPGNRADVVLIDLRLPGMSGLDLMASIKAHGNLPCILITGRGEEAAAAAAMSMGAVDYVIKDHGYITALPWVVEHAHVLAAYSDVRLQLEMQRQVNADPAKDKPS
jgi:DNA-binding NtrC family response regulator